MSKKKDKTKGLQKQHIKKVTHSKSKLASLRSGVFAIIGIISAVALFDMIIPLFAVIIAFSIFYISVKDFRSLSKKEFIISIFVVILLFILSIPVILPIFKIVTGQGESLKTQIVSVETRRKSTAKFKTIEGKSFKSIGIFMDFKLINTRKFVDVEVKFVDTLFGTTAYSIKEIE